MSLLVFPSFNPGNSLASWSYTWPIKQTPMFKTIVQESASGRGDIHIPLMQFPRWIFSWDLSYLKGDNQGVNTAWQLLNNFLMAVQGRGQTWLFQHPYDNIVGTYQITGSVTSGRFGMNRMGINEQLIQASTGASAQITVLGSAPLTIGPYTGTPDASHTWVGQTTGAVYTPTSLPTLLTSQQIGTGDGVTTAFTMFRTLVTSGAPDLIQNFVNPPTIYVNGVAVSSSTYSIDQYGTLTFNTAPSSGYSIAWTGQFYYLCVFDEDEWDDLQEMWYQVWSLKELKFRSYLL